MKKHPPYSKKIKNKGDGLSAPRAKQWIAPNCLITKDPWGQNKGRAKHTSLFSHQ